MRNVLANDRISNEAMKAMAEFHSGIVAEVEAAVAAESWVIVGMAQNPFVKKARESLSRREIKFRYLEYGSYFSKWKERLAIKLWSGWPTFPMVFHKGRFLGGAQELTRYLEENKHQ